MGRPIVSDESELGALGVRIVDTIVHDNLRHLFRPRERRDLGIDGEIELVDEQDRRRRGTGRLLAVQIKCGGSFFAECEGDAYVYRGSLKHLEYWTDLSLPVLIVICDPNSKQAYWTEFHPAAVTRLERGWKILIPKKNVLAEAGFDLESIGRRNHFMEVVDLSVQAWAHARHKARVEFCGIFNLPRDFYESRHLIDIGNEIVLLHWIFASYGRFEIKEVRSFLERLQSGLRYGSRALLCLVAESSAAFERIGEIEALVSGRSEVELVRLLFRREWPQVAELEQDGNLTVEYYRGEPEYRESLTGEWIE